MKKRMTFRNHLKGKALCPMLLCMALVCTACGAAPADDAGTSDSDTLQDNTDDTQQPMTDNNTDSEDSSQTGADQDADSAGEAVDPETDTTISAFDSHIKIEMQNEKEEKTADDGILYFTRSWSYPVVTIEGNEAAAEKINDDIRSITEAYKANSDVEEMALEGYEYYSEEESEYPFLGYDSSLNFNVQRADSNVISFTVDNYAFTGGAHGFSDIFGVNYNAKTGEQISFSDLSDDPDAFHEDTLSYNQKLAQTPSYQIRMFSEEYITDGSLESTLYADDVWYLSTSGLVFMSAPYALGPYASGTIEFLIPYSDLAGMGFKDSYAYIDRFVRKLQEDETYAFDLNGDGEEDSILFHSESTEEADGTYGFILHLSVNDTDFSQDGSDDAITEFLSAFAFGDYYLFDMNVDDDYTELVIFSGENEVTEYVFYSHLFRYTKDGRLIYLGKVRGNVTDPTLEASVI